MNRTDSFNRANTNGGLGTPSDGGSAWAGQGFYGIQSNQGYLAGSSGTNVQTLESSESDGAVKIKVNAFASGNIQLIFRWTDSSHYELVEFNSGGCAFYSNGGFVGFRSFSIADGDTVEVRFSDTAVTIYLNNAAQGADLTASNNLAATKHGFQLQGSTQLVDDFAFTGSGGGDTTPPTLSGPTGTATSNTTADLSVDSDEGNGTLYTVVTTSGTAPSAAQVQAGQDHTGASAAFADSQSVSSTGTKNFAATGLTASTAYYAHYQQKDAVGNDSTVVTSASFTTDAPSAPGASASAAHGVILATNAATLFLGSNDALVGSGCSIWSATNRPSNSANLLVNVQGIHKPGEFCGIPPGETMIFMRATGSITQAMGKSDAGTITIDHAVIQP